MGRAQLGSLKEESGSWRGFWNTYIVDGETGERKRKQRSVLLGPVATMSKAEAKKALIAEIEKATVLPSNKGPRPDPAMTFETFTRTRWMPLREATWRPSSKAGALHTLGHIFTAFGTVPLEKLDKIALQSWLNKLATTHADSLVRHSRIYLKSILEEAVEQDYLRKNPAKSMTMPLTKTVSKDVLTKEQFQAVIAELDTKHSLLVRVGIASALRPSELLALRWRDFNAEKRMLTIRETVYRGELRPFTKTTREGSDEKHLLQVVLPDVLADELAKFRLPVAGICSSCGRDQAHPIHSHAKGHAFVQRSAPSDQFIFATSEGTFIRKENFLNRVLYPVRDKLKLKSLNFQVLRRSFATFSQSKGSVKDVQTQLRHRAPDVSATVYMQSVAETTRQMVNDVYADLIEEPITEDKAKGYTTGK
jgi:integrase